MVPKLSEFIPGKKIHVNDRMQDEYIYILSQPVGKNFALDFTPHFSPQEMLEMGIFEGKYLNDCTAEFPAEWFKKAKVSPQIADINCNYFKIKSRQPLSTWRQKLWITPDDPDIRGWFQWYCRYYLGRRDPSLDDRQIKRWRAFSRHAGQIKKNCHPGDLNCRPKQRQALLQWSHNPFI